MSCRQTAKKLKSLDCPSIHTPMYRDCLKEALEFQPKGKRERAMTMMEDGCDVVVSNRLVVTGIGASITVVMLFIGALAPTSEYSPSKVQAQDVVEEMVQASKSLDDAQRMALENQLQMEFERVISQVQDSTSTMVYELDPRVPMRVVDARNHSHKTFIVSFSRDSAGRLRMKSLVPNFDSTDSTSSAFGKRRVLQYANNNGEIVMLDLAENSTPQSGIVLAGN